jgi:hypothetical protein
MHETDFLKDLDSLDGDQVGSTGTLDVGIEDGVQAFLSPIQMKPQIGC